MYKLILEKKETSDISSIEFDDIVDSFIKYITEEIPDTSDNGIKREGNAISFSSSLVVREIKTLLKNVCSHYIKDLKFKIITE